MFLLRGTNTDDKTQPTEKEKQAAREKRQKERLAALKGEKIETNTGVTSFADIFKRKTPTNEKATAKTEETTKPEEPHGTLAFMGATIRSIFTIFLFFTAGIIFLEKMKFYTTWKMNGRFPDGPPYTTDFPYKNRFMETSDEEEWLPSRFMRWLTTGIIYSFSTNRYYLDKLLNFMGVKLCGEKAPQGKPCLEGIFETILLFIMPFVSLGLILLTPFAGGLTTIIGLILNAKEIIPTLGEFIILVLPLLIPLILYLIILFFSASFLAGGVGLVQKIMMIGLLLVMPLFDAETRQIIVNKMVDNKYIIMVLVFSAMTNNAYKLLGQQQGGAFLGVTLAAIATFIFMRIL